MRHGRTVGKAASIYTDDTITKTSSGAPLPLIVLAQQKWYGLVARLALVATRKLTRQKDVVSAH